MVREEGCRGWEGEREREREGCEGEKTERGAWARVVIPSSPLASLLAAQPGPGSSLTS